VTARVRTAVTIAVLAVLLVIGVAWGYSQVVKPFPGKAEVPLCVDTSYAAGDEITPGDVTVSVLNASNREGLAGRTLQLFEDAGFAGGQISNAPEGTEVKGIAQIWATNRKNPAIPLIRSRIGKVPVREVPDNPALGITVVAGDQFGELVDGLPSVTLKDDATICSPPAG
jgi:hypothetical protein